MKRIARETAREKVVGIARGIAGTSMFVLMFALAWVPASTADGMQTDWSAGPGATGPLAAWDARFEAATQVSWRAVPGQLALAGQALPAAQLHQLAAGQTGAFGIEAGDLDGDGDADLVTAAETLGDLVAWYNDGASPPGFTARVIDGEYPGVAGIAIADINDDGHLDVVATTGVVASRISCYLGDGAAEPTWTRSDLETAWSEGWEIATGDVDGDGRLDVLGTNLTQGDVVWWRNDGAQPIGWTRRVIDASFAGAHSVRAGDIDGDGRADIVATGTPANQIAWWRNEGGDPIAWTRRTLASAFFGGRSVRLGDIDGDGDLDVVGGNFDARVAWWSNPGTITGSWPSQLVTAALGQAHQVQLADMNGDGRLDVLVAGYGGNVAAWFENGGLPAPIAWTRRNVDTLLPRPLAIAAADVDGDGALEFLASSNTTHVFNWYEVTSFATAGELTSSVLDTGAGGPLVLDWDAALPAGTSLQLAVRAGDDPGDLGPWSPALAVPGAVVEPGGRYVQYRAELATGDPAVSPLLREVAVRRSLAPAPHLPGGLGLGAFPNPANPRAVLAFALPAATRASLRILDARGMVVRTLDLGERPAGRHEAVWDGTDAAGRAVASGSYLARLVTGAGTASARLTLLR